MRAIGRAALAAGMMALVGLAGCTADTEPVDGDDHFADGHTHGEEDMHASLADKEFPPFTIEMKGCREAGGISIYNDEDPSPGPTVPFERANMKADVGNPTIGTYGNPITSDFTTGIWHMAGTCDSYTFNGEPRQGEFRYGWVAVKVKAPEFDLEGPARQYFVTDLSFMDREIVQFLRNEVGIHATLMLEGGVEDLGPGLINVVMNDEDHGIFESHLKLKPWGDMVMEPLRQWLYIPADGDLSHGHSHDASGVEGVKYQPVSLHIENHGSGTHDVVDGTGWFSHSRTNHHGEGVNGASGNLAGLMWDGFDRTITLGPIPNVQYDETWLH